MADYKLIGHNYQTPDIVAKVTGRAKYAEDYRADGMLFVKLLLSPMPHARVRNIDASEALKMPGVHAILTADDVPVVGPPARGAAAAEEEGPGRGRGAAAAPPKPNIKPELGLTNEPVYQGEPILAVAAIDELTAAEAIEKIVLDLEPLPFCVDPLQSLRPGGSNARVEGNVFVGPEVKTIKWTDEDWKEVEAGRLPLRDAPDNWNVGDVEAGFKDAALIVDETLVHQSTSHQTLESRSCMAYWQNGKLYLHGSAQSLAHVSQSCGNWAGVDKANVVLVSEYCGGGFGGKNPETAMHMSIPALLSKKTGRPVMMRISREEDHSIGRARPGMVMRAKIGFRKDGRITAMDLFIVQDGGPFTRAGDYAQIATVASANYTPLNMRFRGTAVLTNTPPRGPQRGPGGEQSMTLLEPLISKAARQLGIDQIEIRKINAPITGSAFGPPNARGNRAQLTGAFAREALDKGAALFKWDERKQRSGVRRGTKVTGLGVGLSNFSAGTIGFDGLLTIRPDGKLYIQQGVGNLGTLSVFDTARVAAETLDMPWEKCEVTWGSSGKNVPWSSRQGGSQTAHANSRANLAAGLDAKRKLQEIAAKDLGGSPDDYDVAKERVFRKGNPGRGLTFAQAAKRAIELGGKYDGHELPKDINSMTAISATGLAGLGLMGVAKDNYPRRGTTQAFVAGFAEVEVDVETGAYRILDYLAVADVGTVLNPRGLEGQLHGGAIMGFGHTRSQHWVYDQQYGVPLAKRFHYNKPMTILDIPTVTPMQWAAVDIPDPQTPVGVKGVAEAAVGAGSAALRCALAAAIGDDLIRRTPVTPAMILESLEAGKRVDRGLTSHV
ncbi:MAG: xanthine dehydrogenase family protein molybdopterin-binding subunit [Acidobacteria bacterium]|nr:MAG: xanthine dehydrogenase family protein molybdopterin-binding subunit [Acidobacteriota bacterium]